jgi:hypothetical protein
VKEEEEDGGRFRRRSVKENKTSSTGARLAIAQGTVAGWREAKIAT